MFVTLSFIIKGAACLPVRYMGFFYAHTFNNKAFTPCNSCNGYCSPFDMDLATGSRRRFFYQPAS